VAARTVWRCFPWDPEAPEGAPFSASHLVPGQTSGRFDLQDRPPVRYLAETPEHALAEALGPFRGTRFHISYLRQQGHALAMVEVQLASSLVARVADCTDPAVLAELELRPDALAHHDRTLTQAIARRLHDRDTTSDHLAGLRWWSALTGAWHTTVIFTDRERRGEMAFGMPRHVHPANPVVARTLAILGIRTL
jgi:hypothetical protein